MSSVLSNLRVLDMTRVVAGPLATQILGDFGADIIKVERPFEGDDVRHVGPPWLNDASGAETRESTYFQSVNRNKRSIAVDFKTPEGAALLCQLADKADVFVENYRPGTLAKYGLGYDDLRATNPSLIYCSVTGFGQSGPYSNRSGYDFLMQAMSGLMSVTGMPDGPPLRVGVPIADITAGMNAAIGILIALRHREATGEGQWIDISLFESQVAAMPNPFAAWFNGENAIPRTGNDHPSAAPYGVYRVADGHLLIATFNDREFGRLANSVDRAEWSSDPRFASMGARVANRRELAEELGVVLIEGTRAQWIEKLNAANVSCGPINTMADLEMDPHIHARNMVVELDHCISGDIRLAANPIRCSASPPEYRMGPPSIGQNTIDVLKDVLLLGDQEIEGLKSAGAI